MAELLGGLAGSVQGTLTGLVNQGQSFLDRFMPPERRAELWAKFQKFLHEKPALASFLLSHIAISGLPLLLFIALTITVGVFSIVGALLVGLLGALLFIVVAVGFALIILLPTLFFTTLVATFLWLWGMGTYYILKYFNKKEIPGLHTDLPGTEGLNLDALNKEPDYGAVEKEREEEKENKANGHAGEKKREGGGAPKLANGTPKKSGQGQGKPLNDVTDNVGKATGVDVGNATNGVTKKVDVGNVTKNVGDLGGVKGKLDGVTKNSPIGGLTSGITG